jgi:hypothetical protein
VIFASLTAACDECDRTYMTADHRMAVMFRKLHEAGWKCLAGRETLCPVCKVPKDERAKATKATA